MGDAGRRRDVDSGWAWVVLVASFLILALQGSYGMAVGYFQVEFVESFSGSKGFIALIGALSLSGQSLLGPVAGILTNLLSTRVTVMIGAALMSLALFTASFSQDLTSLLFLFGILSSIGTGLCYTPSVTVVSLYFDRYQTLATGICLASSGLGLLACPHLLRWLIDMHGWRYALAVYGGLMAQICVLASLFYPHDPSQTPSCGGCCDRETGDHDGLQAAKLQSLPEDRQLERLKEERNAQRATRKDMVGSRTALHMSEFGSVMLTSSVVWTVEEGTSSSLKQRLGRLARSKFMWVMCLNQFLLFAGFSIDTIFFPAYSKSVGVAFADLPMIYTVFGVTMAVSRVAGGVVFTLVPNRHMWKTFFVLQVMVAILMGLMPLYGVSFSALCVYKLLLGITYGPTFLLVSPILIRYLGLEDLSVAFGVIMMCCGLAFVIAPPVGGLMTDLVENYIVVFIIAGTLIGLAVLSLLLLLVIKDLKPMQELRGNSERVVSDTSSGSDEEGGENLPLCGSNNVSLEGSVILPDSEKVPINDAFVEVTDGNDPLDVPADNSANAKARLVNGDGKPQVYVISDLEDLNTFLSDCRS